MLLADDALDSGTDDLGLHGAARGGEEELLADSGKSRCWSTTAWRSSPPTSRRTNRWPPPRPTAPRAGTGAGAATAREVVGYGDAIPFHGGGPLGGDAGHRLSDVDGALGAYDAGVESAVDLPPEEEISLTPSARVPVAPAVTASQYPVRPSRAASPGACSASSVPWNPASAPPPSRAIPTVPPPPRPTAEPCLPSRATPAPAPPPSRPRRHPALAPSGGERPGRRGAQRGRLLPRPGAARRGPGDPGHRGAGAARPAAHRRAARPAPRARGAARRRATDPGSATSGP